jgi:hypothetical protein
MILLPPDRLQVSTLSFGANLPPVIRSAGAVLEILGRKNQDKQLRRFGKLSSRPETRAYRRFPNGSGIRADLSP